MASAGSSAFEYTTQGSDGHSFERNFPDFAEHSDHYASAHSPSGMNETTGAASYGRIDVSGMSEVYDPAMHFYRSERNLAGPSAASGHYGLVGGPASGRNVLEVVSSERYSSLQPTSYHRFGSTSGSASTSSGSDPSSPYSNVPLGSTHLSRHAAYGSSNVTALVSPPLLNSNGAVSLTLARFGSVSARSTIAPYGSSSFSKEVTLPPTIVPANPQHPLASSSAYIPPSSLSPTDSNGSSYHAVPDPTSRIDNDTVARMIATAQAEGHQDELQSQMIHQKQQHQNQQLQQQQSAAMPVPSPVFTSVPFTAPAPTYSIQQSAAAYHRPPPFAPSLYQDANVYKSSFSSAYEFEPIPLPPSLEPPTMPSIEPMKSNSSAESGFPATIMADIVPAAKIRRSKIVEGKKTKTARATTAIHQERSDSLSNEDDALRIAAASNLDTIANAGILIDSTVPPVIIKTRKAYVKKDKREKLPKKVVEKKVKVVGEKGHNAVEKRYRNTINQRIAILRDIVPALRHLKPLPSMSDIPRRASQFSLPTAATCPTPAGLIDGIPAARTLSKGTILGKSVEYIKFLQGARNDAQEDLEMLKQVVRESASNGSGERLIKLFENTRSLVEQDREIRRTAERAEQKLIDAEDDSDAEDDVGKGDLAAVPAVPGTEVNRAKRPLVDDVSGGDSARTRTIPGNFGATASDYVVETNQVSPNSDLYSSSSSYGGGGGGGGGGDGSISPQYIDQHPSQHIQYQYQHHQQAARNTGLPPRILLASFLGFSFAGGVGYDWTYNMVDIASDVAVASPIAWISNPLAARSFIPEVAPSYITNLPLASFVTYSSVQNALLFLGISTLLSAIGYLLYPVFGRLTLAIAKNRDNLQRNRAVDALSQLTTMDLSRLSEDRVGVLKARRELLSLVGAPTLRLIPAMLKEGLSVLLWQSVGVSVSDLPGGSQKERREMAAAWVRIAEIEATIGMNISYFSRSYTFLRLYNLSRSTNWPVDHPSTALTSVNAILAVHLITLGHSRTAHSLWSKTTHEGRKKSSDTVLLPSWVEIALATDFDRVRSIIEGQADDAMDVSQTESMLSLSQTRPLLLISEIRCEAALKEVWAQIFVAVMRTSTGLQPTKSVASETVDQSLLEEEVEVVLASTVSNTTVHYLAQITKAAFAYRSGRIKESHAIAQLLSKDRSRGGATSRLACASSFFNLLLGDSIDDSIEPVGDVDVLASVTFGWLAIRRLNEAMMGERAGFASPKVDIRRLHSCANSIRRLLGMDTFRDATLSKQEIGLEASQDACIEALTEITRGVVGLSVGSDSGVEM